MTDVTKHGPWKFTPEARQRFCEHLRTTGRWGASARAVDIHRMTANRALLEDEAFAQAVADARAERNEDIEEAIIERGVKGVIVEQITDPDTGIVVRERRQFSDVLLKLAAQANMREKYGDRKSIEQNTTVTATVAHTVQLDLSVLSDVELAALEGISAKLAGIEA